MAISSDILRLFAPETAHAMAIEALKLGLGPQDSAKDDPILETSLFNLDFRNPIGLAAGFDKNAEVPDAMLGFGFGFVEAGTITPLPQPGNPKPRLFRDTASGSVINRMGFNGQGLDAAEARLKKRRRTGIVGANVGRNKTSPDAVADYVTCIGRLAPLADYLVINISSPNTPGLRDLQEAAALQGLLQASIAARNESAASCPLLVKIAPDLDDEVLAAIVDTAIAHKLDGLVMGNTTLSRPAGLPDAFAREAGGLSGRPLCSLSTERLRATYRLAKGRIPLIGVGGVASGEDAYEKICAGASLVQLYSALVFGGPGLVGEIKSGLARCLREGGFRSLREAVGSKV